MQTYDINNKALPYSTGNCIQYPEKNHNGAEENMCVCVCVAESLSCTIETDTTL